MDLALVSPTCRLREWDWIREANATILQAWIEASTKGAVLLFVAAEAEYVRTNSRATSASKLIECGAGTTLVHSAPAASPRVSPEESPEALRRLMPRWASAHA